MKNFLLGCAAVVVTAGAAFATDLPARAPSPIYKAVPLTTPSTWQGIYFGVHGGYGWGDHESLAVTSITAKPTGGFGGIQAGYNGMVAPNWLLGGEIQLSGGDINDRVVEGATSARSKIDFFGVALTRLGYTFDRTLVYAAVGAAWAQNKADDPGGAFRLTESRAGWAIGGGLEYAIDSRWSAKIEYLRADFGGMTIVTSGADRYRADLILNTVKFGLNYRFAENAPAAAMPVKAMPREAYSWAGSYIGGNVGYVWGDASESNPILGAGSSSVRARDWSLGVQSGYNWIFAPNLLLGVEADNALLDVEGRDADANVKITNASTVRARLGYFNDRTLIYGTGGLAIAKEKYNGNGASVSAYQMGWVAGGGIEYMFAPRWSTKIEYLYTDYGRTNADFPNIGDSSHSSLKAQSVTLGLNYKFDLAELLRR